MSRTLHGGTRTVWDGLGQVTRFRAKVRRFRSSLAVAPRRHAVERLGVEDGDLLEFVVRRVDRDYFGAVRGLGTFTEAHRLQWP